MNIAIFTDTFLPKIDGIAVSLKQFISRLSAKGHNFIVFCPAYSENDTIFFNENTRIIRFKSYSLPSYPDVKIVLPSKKKILEEVKGFNVDIIHIQSPGILGQYGVVAAKKLNLPLAGTYHTMISEQGTYISPYRLLKIDKLVDLIKSGKKVKKKLKKIERKKKKTIGKKIIQKLVDSVYEKSDLIITPSNLIRETLIKEGVQTRIRVISNGLDLSYFSASPRQIQTSPYRLLHVGRISYEKNIEVVLKAFKLINEKFSGSTLDIFGDGPALASLKKEARQLSIDNVVVFHGFVEHSMLNEVYRRFDLFLTASTMETQGLVVLEAISSALPCIGVDAFALPELIEHDHNGIIVEPFDHEQMGRAAIDLLQDPERYHRFSENCLRVAARHDLNSCSEYLESTYQELIKDHQKQENRKKKSKKNV